MVLAALLCACVADEPALPEPELREAVLPGLEDCRGLFAETDARVADAGVRHEGYQRIPGFPYLRTDRTLAGFAREAHSDEAVGTWVRRMRAHDAEAREYELHNLGLENPERRNLHTDLYRCGRGLAFIDLQVPHNLALLRDHAARIAAGTPSASGPKAMLARLWTPFAQLRQARREAQLREVFEQPLPAAGAQLIWQAESTRQRGLVPMHLDALRQDALGYPGMIASAWRALAEKHAPELWLPDGVDAPAALVWDGEHRLRARTQEPTVYYRVDFQRDEQALLPKLHYLTVLAKPDSERPRILQWWVTLGPDVEALGYESTTAGGLRLRFPAHAAANGRFPDSDGGAFTLAPRTRPGQPALLRIREQAPHLGGVLDRELADAARVRSYRLQSMDLLFQLPLPEGGSRSALSRDESASLTLVEGW